MAHSTATMIGRERELAEAREVLRTDLDTSEQAPRQRVLLLSGDAGVGKTRLLRALRDDAVAQGWQVLAGHCLDFGDSELPYLPFSEVLGRLAALRPDLVDAVAADHPALTRLQPGRRTRSMPDDDSDATRGPDRTDTFVAVHALLEAAAAQAPLLLVVEDLHWADPSTRDLLGFLFSRSFTQPVAIVASYRSDDLHRRHPLRRLVAEWMRVPAVGRLSVDPLPDVAVRRLIAALGPDLVESAVGRIVARAEGNAFFVEELVAAGPGDDEVPDDLADLLLIRLDRLSGQAHHVVRVASAAGRKVSHELLAATVDSDAAALDEGIRQAIEMHVLEAGNDQYSFRHALLGEAVYDDLLPGERVRLHARFAEVLASGEVAGTSAELARHARRANDLDRAVLASVDAGDEAVAVGGPSVAADHYQQALELLADGDRGVRLGIDVSRLVVKAAEALTASGEAQRAVHLLEASIEALPPDAPNAARARLLSHHADLLTIVDSALDPVARSKEAVGLAPAGDSPLRAKVLVAHARVLAAEGRTEEAEGVATDALALAERLGRPVLVAEAVTTLSGLRIRSPGDADARQALRTSLESAVERAFTEGAFQAEVRGRFLLGRSHEDAGEWDRAAQWFGSVVERGAPAGLRWSPFVIESRWHLALVEYTRGNWDRVLELTEVADDPNGPAIPRGIVGPVRLAVLAARGEDVGARLRDLRRLWSDEGVIGVNSAGGELELCSDAAAALAIHRDVVATMSRYWGESFGGRVRLSAQALAAVARSVTATGAAGDRSELLVAADGLRAEGEAVVAHHQENGLPWGPEGRAWSSRLMAEHLRVRWLAGAEIGRTELLEAWRAAVEGFVAFGHVPEEARARATYAEVLHLVGDGVQARAEAVAARELAERLRAPGLVSGLRVGATRAVRDRSQGAVVPTLTAREQEILALVADGRSNGEIGKQLFISTKTVSVHVSNILAKLSAATRTEAAAIAHRDGLLTQR